MTTPRPHEPSAPRPRWDLEALRDANPIEQVVAASGVELHPRGRGYVGCCPFHEDDTPSLSVAGIPGRFHCFGCGAHGDVIDYVSRITGADFVEAVRALQRGDPLGGHPHAQPPCPVRLHVVPSRHATTSVERGWQINQLAWEHFTAPAAAAHAQAWLRHHRGVDVEQLRHENGDLPLAGYASPSRHSLITHLRALGVTDTELLDLDLAYQRSHGAPVDSYRGRIVLPVRDTDGHIQGFLGRDTTGHPAAPKYRNPTRTPTFDKASVLYRPTQHRLDQVATIVIVEGALDALAIAAAAAQAGQSHRFAPVTTSGVTVSAAQADAVLAIHGQLPVIALDPDQAGRDGARRWLHLLALTRRRLAMVTDLPTGSDPADWLSKQGVPGLAAFDRTHLTSRHPGRVHPHLPGHELVQATLDGDVSNPVPAVLGALIPLASQLRGHARDELLAEVEREMTAQGWNPRGDFSHELDRVLDSGGLQASRRGRGPTPLELPAGPGPDVTPPSRPPSRTATPSLT